MSKTPSSGTPQNGEDRARAMLRGMAGFIRSIRAPNSWSELPDHEFQRMAFLACLTFERHPERAMTMFRLFADLASRLGVSDRLRLLGTVTAFVEEGRASAESLMPFILFDHSDAVISVASREYALLHPSPAENPMEGCGLLLARVDAVDMLATRKAAVLAGLVSLGDMRLCGLVLGKVDMFSGPAARRALACTEGAFTTLLQVEFLLDWLEHTTLPEDAIAAADALAALPGRSASGMVSEVERVFPSTAAPAGEELRVVHQLTFMQALERVRPRLATMAMLAELEGEGALSKLGPTGASKSDAKLLVCALERVMKTWSHATASGSQAAAA